MSPDTLPPPSEPGTLPGVPVEAIVAGEANRATTEAFAALYEALRRAEAVADACARALDAQAGAR
jgi:hypothetical protein